MEKDTLKTNYLTSFWEDDSFNSRLDILVKKRTLSLLGNVKNKKILDIGCGSGKLCRLLSKKGGFVTGIDFLKSQIEVAKQQEAGQPLGIKYSQKDFFSNNFESDQKFNIIISHLVHVYYKGKAFKNSFKKIYNLLSKDGVYIYASNHPSRVFYNESSGWIKTYHNPKRMNYFKNELLKMKLISLTGSVFNNVDYHHTFSETVNSIIAAGFVIEKIIEPSPNNEEMKEFPQFKDEKRLPAFLIIVARKPSIN